MAKEGDWKSQVEKLVAQTEEDTMEEDDWVIPEEAPSQALDQKEKAGEHIEGEERKQEEESPTKRDWHKVEEGEGGNEQ